MTEPSHLERAGWIQRAGSLGLFNRLEEMSATTGGLWVDVKDMRAIGDRLLVLLDWRSRRAHLRGQLQRAFTDERGRALTNS